MFQQIFTPNPQTAMGFALPDQDGLQFPASLTEKYCPRKVEDFIGLARPKTLFSNLLKNPKPIKLLAVGPPGSGKTTMAMAFAEQLGGSLKHVAAQKCDVATLEELRDQLAYAPQGGWWVVLVDEADQMTEKAQVQLLSRLDETANMKPKFGGGFERGQAPIIWIFTCNGRGLKETDPPPSLLPRFQSRCQTIEFEANTDAEIAGHLEKIWNREGGDDMPADWFLYMAKGVGVRDAVNRIQTDLLAGPRPIPPLVITEQVAAKVFPRHTSSTLQAARSSAAHKAWETRRKRLQGCAHA